MAKTMKNRDLIANNFPVLELSTKYLQNFEVL